MNPKTYIKKHQKYIDYRLNIISDYVSNESTEIYLSLHTVINYFITPSAGQEGAAEIVGPIDALAEIKALTDNWDILNDGDIFGYIYQYLQNQDSKKKKGQFFTPPEVVHYIVHSLIDKMPSPDKATFLDPACGSGQFLITLFHALIDFHKSRGLTQPESAKKIIHEQITGFDIDPIAVFITKENLSRISGLSREEINIHQKDFLFQQDLLTKSKPETDRQWDAVLGNPPWGSSLAKEQKKYALQHYTSAGSGINTFTLFIEQALDYVTPSGLISFLIPEAYLNIKAHRTSRELILSHCCINEITIWGEQFKGVFAPSVSLMVTRTDTSAERKKNIVKIFNSQLISTNSAVVIPQNAYYSTHENIFNIHYTRKCINVLSSIEDQDCFYLKEKSRFYLGIVTGNNDRFISNIQSDEYPDPILTGKDIEQYSIKFNNNYFKYSKENLQQVAPQHLYKINNKILYKFIGKRLTFVHDTRGYYSLNNINGLITDQDIMDNETLVSILNSDLMQYYYENSFFTLKVLKRNLEKLPIKPIRKNSQVKLKKLIEDISETHGESRKKARANIEDIIFNEYNIKDKEAYIISNR